MNKFMLLLLIAFLFIGCSNKEKTSKATFTLNKMFSGISKVGGTEFQGGLMIWATNGMHDLAIGFPDELSVQDVVLPNGIWSFYVVGWSGYEGSVYKGKMTGDFQKCGFVNNVEINGSDVNVNINLNKSSCLNQEITESTFISNEMASPYLPKRFKKVKLNSCLNFNNLAFPTDSCDAKEGISQSFKIEYVGNNGLSSAPGLISECYKKSMTSGSGANNYRSKILTDVRLPVLGYFPTAVRIHGYSTDDCSEANSDKVVYNYPFGFGKDGNSDVHIITGGTDTLDTYQNTAVFFADNYVGYSDSIFDSSLPLMNCSSGVNGSFSHCFNKLNTSAHNHDKFDHVMNQVTRVFGSANEKSGYSFIKKYKVSYSSSEYINIYIDSSQLAVSYSDTTGVGRRVIFSDPNTNSELASIQITNSSYNTAATFLAKINTLSVLTGKTSLESQTSGSTSSTLPTVAEDTSYSSGDKGKLERGKLREISEVINAIGAMVAEDYFDISCSEIAIGNMPYSGSRSINENGVNRVVSYVVKPIGLAEKAKHKIPSLLTYNSFRDNTLNQTIQSGALAGTYDSNVNREFDVRLELTMDGKLEQIFELSCNQRMGWAVAVHSKNQTTASLSDQEYQESFYALSSLPSTERRLVFDSAETRFQNENGSLRVRKELNRFVYDYDYSTVEKIQGWGLSIDQAYEGTDLGRNSFAGMNSSLAANSSCLAQGALFGKPAFSTLYQCQPVSGILKLTDVSSSFRYNKYETEIISPSNVNPIVKYMFGDNSTYGSLSVLEISSDHYATPTAGFHYEDRATTNVSGTIVGPLNDKFADFTATLSPDIRGRFSTILNFPPKRAVDLTATSMSLKQNVVPLNTTVCLNGWSPVASLTGIEEEFCVAQYEMAYDGTTYYKSQSLAPSLKSYTDALGTCSSSNIENINDIASSVSLITNLDWQRMARLSELTAMNWQNGVVGMGTFVQGKRDDQYTYVAGNFVQDVIPSFGSMTFNVDNSYVVMLNGYPLAYFAGGYGEYVQLPSSLNSSGTSSIINGASLTSTQKAQYAPMFAYGNTDVLLGFFEQSTTGTHVLRGGHQMISGSSYGGLYDTRFNDGTTSRAFRCKYTPKF